MRPLLVALVIALLSLGPIACGGSQDHGSNSSSAAATVQKPDRDDDGDNNDDDNVVLGFGHAATGAESQPLIKLVTAYLAAAATSDGAKACTLLMPFVAESVVENLSHSPGLNGSTCAVVMSKLFKQHHSELADKNRTLKFYAIRVSPGKALTVLSFSVLPEVRQLAERRTSSGRWRMLTLLDGIIE